MNLRLERRTTDELSRGDGDEDTVQRLRFHVLFSYDFAARGQPAPWLWEEADIVSLKERATPPESDHSSEVLNHVLEPVLRKNRFQLRRLFTRKEIKNAGSLTVSDHPKPDGIITTIAVQASRTPNFQNTNVSKDQPLDKIGDLCESISRRSQLPQQETCLGFLQDELSEHKHCIYRTQEAPSDHHCWSTLSLQAILKDPKACKGLTRLHRLRIAVTLASSILQLCETPWLAEEWDKNDILFLQKSDGPLYDRPFVSKRIMAKRTATGSTASVSTIAGHQIVRNRTLFALGVLLIELHFGKPLVELRGAELYGQPTILQTWTIADGLVDTLYFEAGIRYGNAVRRCIRCDFDRKDTDLQDNEFREVVYAGVVSLLEANLKDFTG